MHSAGAEWCLSAVGVDEVEAEWSGEVDDGLTFAVADDQVRRPECGGVLGGRSSADAEPPSDVLGDRRPADEPEYGRSRGAEDAFERVGVRFEMKASGGS
jgi:hypothetical protein